MDHARRHNPDSYVIGIGMQINVMGQMIHDGFNNEFFNRIAEEQSYPVLSTTIWKWYAAPRQD